MLTMVEGVLHHPELGDVPYEMSEGELEFVLGTVRGLEAMVPTTRDVFRVDHANGHRIELTHRGSQTVQAVRTAVRNRNEWCFFWKVWFLTFSAMFILGPSLDMALSPDNPIPGSRIMRSIALGLPFVWGFIYVTGRCISDDLLIADRNPDFDVTPDGYVAKDGEKYTPERRKADVEVYCAQIRHLLPKRAHLADQIVREYEARGTK